MAARPVPLTVGEPAPWFFCRTQRRQRFAFDTIAGRYIVLCFFGSAAAPLGAAVLESLRTHRARFDDEHLSFFGVSLDPADEFGSRAPDSIPGIRYFWDFDRSVSALYGAIDRAGVFRPVTYVLDPALRVLAVVPFLADARRHVEALYAILEKLPEIGAPSPALSQAPVLVVSSVFEPAFCRGLVNYYDTHGGEESGFMRDVDGKTVALFDPDHKRRKDRVIEDEALSAACLLRIRERLVPQIRKAFQFAATRMERYIISCYDAQEGGHFRAHRDNTTKGTVHRRFAVSLFLNSGEYEGGFLRFPEFGPSLYTAPAGGAIVFSCSLLHEATGVTRGRRYMFLPFLYDDAAARIREENLPFVDPSAAVPLRKIGS
jgi:peroxiredoxin/predicted 2-oxoglutarate/Fe(II)-dependent dioxygenase YbiX